MAARRRARGVGGAAVCEPVRIEGRLNASGPELSLPRREALQVMRLGGVAERLQPHPFELEPGLLQLERDPSGIARIAVLAERALEFHLGLAEPRHRLAQRRFDRLEMLARDVAAYFVVRHGRLPILLRLVLRRTTTLTQGALGCLVKPS